MYQTVENASKLIEELIRCAGKRFKESGFRVTTMDDIARDLHISKRTIYTLFSSKEEILREVAWRDTLDAVRAFAASVPPGTPSDRIIIALCRNIFSDRMKEGAAGRFFGIHHKDSALREAYREALRRIFSHLYEDGRQHGRLKPADPDFAAAAVLALLITASDRFDAGEKAVKMFNDTLSMIADAVAYRDRAPFEALR